LEKSAARRTLPKTSSPGRDRRFLPAYWREHVLRGRRVRIRAPLKLGDFGFWILDFGLKTKWRAIPQSKIGNPKSKMTPRFLRANRLCDERISCVRAYAAFDKPALLPARKMISKKVKKRPSATLRARERNADALMPDSFGRICRRRSLGYPRVRVPKWSTPAFLPGGIYPAGQRRFSVGGAITRLPSRVA
jgi:hypothetical protein